MIEPALGDLLRHGIATGLIEPLDVTYVRNRVLEVLGIQRYDLTAEDSARNQPNTAGSAQNPPDIDSLLAPLLDDAVARGLIAPDTPTQRDLWDSAIMGCFLPRPSEVNRRFRADHSVSPQTATDRLHDEAVAANYIRLTRTGRNVSWRQPTRYGAMDITINLSKPERDPRDIAAARESEGTYPACLLCPENEGYAGRADHPARQNLRLVELPLGGERWFLQYSPYRYYPEHCIVLSEEHRPMRIDRATFDRLAEVTSLLPHYIVGSNADLPIVGGSILSHDHYQGGRYRFPMEDAAVLLCEERQGVDVQVLDWPLAVLRLRGPDESVLTLAERLLDVWRIYEDPARDILARTGDQPHNTITPIARREEGRLRLDLVLRNNRCTSQHPDGLFHPHAEIHSVKKENIGLIEVMGVAVLPGRLDAELRDAAHALVGGGVGPPGHADMVRELLADPVAGPDDALDRVRLAAGARFVQGLEHCGVFGADTVAGTREFLAAVDAK